MAGEARHVAGEARHVAGEARHVDGRYLLLVHVGLDELLQSEDGRHALLRWI